jgi:hypothetical protein
MNKVGLYEALNYVDASREKRGVLANQVVSQQNLIPLIIEITTEENAPISCKASWVLEYVAKKDLHSIVNHLNQFILLLPKLHLESSIRPATKICELLMKAYFGKKPHSTQKELTENHLKCIAEAAFDWLIGKHKVAPKAHSMTILLLLGSKIDWIHPELKLILNQNYPTGSAAYKARARITLEVLEKSKSN